MKFQKGVSGNPEGRRREDAELKAAIRPHTPRIVTRLLYWMESDDGKHSVDACKELLDRGYGKPAQAIQHSGDDEADPINVRHSFQVLGEMFVPASAKGG